jgi:peptide-methionine (S)-S-oxide reductase
MAAASGVIRTRVGYCGGLEANPTYRKVLHKLILAMFRVEIILLHVAQVCGEKSYSDWAEVVQLDFDERTTSFEDLLGLFFSSHDYWLASSKRQYMSAIFYHNEDQKLTAIEAVRKLSLKRRVATLIEPATDFYMVRFSFEAFPVSIRYTFFTGF